MARRLIAKAALVFAALGLSCAQDRATGGTPPVYAQEVSPILETRCVSCHEGSTPSGGWRATSFLDAIACVASGAAAALPADARAPMLSALDTPTHHGLVNDQERAILEAWVSAGTPAFRAAVHTAGIVDPRSDAWHGKLLRERRWAPMLDASDPDACGRCHDGSPSRPAEITMPAPGATACTSCHKDENGVLACTTCHGNGQRTYPPRDPCFFPADAGLGSAHAAHVEPSATHEKLVCSTCHPAPGAEVIGGVHGNGNVEIAFDAKRVGPGASYDPSTGACTVSCHDRGGARARPLWTDAGPMRCGDCHGSPPAGHVGGPCTTCHHQANADGTALTAGTAHLNGVIDLGDGSGRCGACHGTGDDPWPSTGAHPSHKAPLLTLAAACTDCHIVPAAIVAPGHMNGVVDVALSGRAVARAAPATWNGHTCSSVACHGANLTDPPAITPSWTDASHAASACGACHGIPPTQHTASTSCDRSNCHGSEIVRTFTSLSISESGKALHINGAIDTAQ